MGSDQEKEVGDLAGRDALNERRQYERRAGKERRGSLRWDPQAIEKERRSGTDRRQVHEYG